MAGKALVAKAAPAQLTGRQRKWARFRLKKEADRDARRAKGAGKGSGGRPPSTKVHKIDYSEIEPDARLREVLSAVLGVARCRVFTAVQPRDRTRVAEVDRT